MNKIIFITGLLVCVYALEIFAQSIPRKKNDDEFLWIKRKYATRQHWYWGIGAVVSDIPVIQSRFRVPFSQILYEYNLGDLDKGIRFAIGGGFYGLNAVLPVPAIQPSLYIGSENRDIMARISAGAFSDVIVNRHSGILLSGGVVIKNRLDISLVIVPVGTQPVRPYPEVFGSLEEKFIPVGEVSFNKDINGNALVQYDAKHYHQDDPRYDATSAKFYSSYDMDYGNATLVDKDDYSKNPDTPFDYVKGREYIKFPYFGIMVTFRH